MQSYHSHHSPFGAFASFTIGLEGARGGFGQSLAGPAKQNVYVGTRTAGEKWTLLPFFEDVRISQAAAYTGESGFLDKDQGGVGHILLGSDYQRKLEPGTDEWSSNGFTFTLYSYFGKGDLGANLRRVFRPSILATLKLENPTTEPMEMIFGLQNPEGPFRPLRDMDPNRRGFAYGTRWGFETPNSPNVREVQAFSVLAPNIMDENGLHRISHEAALVFTVAPGETLEVPIALGFYAGGPITTGRKHGFYYAEVFSDLEDVLAETLIQVPQIISSATSIAKPLDWDNDRWFLFSQSVHSYYGSSEALYAPPLGPNYVVNEGEYRMMNTFDLTVDHLFFELDFHPECVRRVLVDFWKHHQYTDQIHHPDGTVAPGGISFTHDMGVNDQFTPDGLSSYESPHLTGCFSHMTVEELLNFMICYSGTILKTGPLDLGATNVWDQLAESLLRRDHPNADKRTGLIQWDSMRTGMDGAEITTYDSLDVSLGQTRNNIYIAVKCLGAWMMMERIAETAEQKAIAREAADRIVQTLITKFDQASGTWVAVFEAGNESRIIPACEGLAYPLAFGFGEELHLRYRDFLDLMKTHLQNVLVPDVCLDPISGGWKLSSTSKNTWFSKIALCQYVVTKLFPELLSGPAGAADKVHAAWQKGPCGPWAMCDQIMSDTGVPCGSKYYPRGVTTWLWFS